MEKDKLTKKDWIEISKKFDAHKVPEFSNSFRGYDKEQVDLYISALVDEYLALCDDLSLKESELEEYKEKEKAISDAVIRAEQLSASAKDDAVFSSVKKQSITTEANSAISADNLAQIEPTERTDTEQSALASSAHASRVENEKLKSISFDTDDFVDEFSNPQDLIPKTDDMGIKSESVASDFLLGDFDTLRSSSDATEEKPEDISSRISELMSSLGVSEYLDLVED